MPELHIITGSNGAGKSSVGSTYLPQYIQDSCEVFDGDKLFIQKQKQLWQQGITAIKEARNLAYDYVSNLFDEYVDKAIQANTNFVYEGHFINEATWDVPKRFKSSGYQIHLVFLGLSNIFLSESRVLERAKHGGHYVRPEEIAANYYGNLEKLNKYYTLFDTVLIIDTSEPRHKLIYYSVGGDVMSNIPEPELPEWCTAYLPNIIHHFKAMIYAATHK